MAHRQLAHSRVCSETLPLVNAIAYKRHCTTVLLYHPSNVVAACMLWLWFVAGAMAAPFAGRTSVSTCICALLCSVAGQSAPACLMQHHMLSQTLKCSSHSSARPNASLALAVLGQCAKHQCVASGAYPPCACVCTWLALIPCFQACFPAHMLP